MTRSRSDVSPRRRTLLLGGGGAALVGLRAQAQPTDLRKVTLRVGDQTGATQGLLRAAGLLGDVPFAIDWSQYAAAVNLHEALKAGAIDIGSASDSPTVSAISGGSRIVVVGAWQNGGKGTSLLVPKNSKITRLADLRGKTVSPTTRGSVGHFLTVGLLNEAGLQPADVKLAYLAPTDAAAAFGSGSIDAWATWGIFKARAIGVLGARELDNGERINSGLGILSATQAAVRDPAKLAAIRHYEGLVDESYDWGRRNRDAYLDWYAAFTKQDKALVASTYAEGVDYRRVPIDDALVARLKKTHDVWLANGLLSGPIDFDAVVLRDAKA